MEDVEREQEKTNLRDEERKEKAKYWRGKLPKAGSKRCKVGGDKPTPEGKETQAPGRRLGTRKN